MSVQLIVFPQGFNGVYSQFNNPANEFIVNGINFTGLDNTPTAFGQDISNTMDIYPATIPNAWYRYGWSGQVGTPIQYPTAINGNCFIPNATTGSFGGVYQKVTGLTTGVIYTLTITIVKPPQPTYKGTIRVVRKHNILGSSTVFNSFAITEKTLEITMDVVTNAQGQLYDETIFVGYRRSNNSSSGCTISSISLQAKSSETLLNDGQVICDLYEDEDLPLTLSVDEFKNVAEKPQSYSKAFNLPATKRNNRIFDQIFEITRDLNLGSPQFNPYQKTQCTLKQDGLLIFQGYLRLLDIVDKEGEISYNVNLYSEVIALADLLKDKKFSDLSFTELEHDYNITQIENSNNNGLVIGQTTPLDYLNPNTSGLRTGFNTIKYPFIDWNRQWVIANGSTPNATSGHIELKNLEQAFRPCVNIKYLIDRIFNQPDNPFTYTSNFFNSNEFAELFMDFNWGSEENGASPPTDGFLYRQFDEASDYYFNSPNWTKFKLNESAGFNNGPNLWDNTDYKFTSPVSNLNVQLEYYLRLINTDVLGSRANGLRICKFNAAGNIIQTLVSDTSSISAGGSKVVIGTITTMMQIGDYIQAQANSQSENIIKIQDSQPNCFMDFWFGNESSQVDTLLLQARAELGQWEFLKGLINMFNLVTIPDKDNPNNIIIEPYVDVFVNNINNNLNWTDKIDISEMKLEPLTDLTRRTIFKYVEDEDDYAFQNFKQATSGFLYGSYEYDATDEFNILEGIEEIEASPFAATVIKSIDSQFPNFVTPAMYSLTDDGNAESFDNSPRIFYNRGIEFTGTSYFIPAQNGAAEKQAQTYGCFSHLRSNIQVSQYRDLNFGSQQLLPNVPNSTINNLYNLYWSDYFNELYNINTRIMTIKVNLSPADINTFKFNDKIMIKNRVFRVNKINYKPNDLSTVEFILLQ